MAIARTSLTRARHLGAVRDRGLLALAVGVFLGADWGAAIAATIDSRGNTLSRPLELVDVSAPYSLRLSRPIDEFRWLIVPAAKGEA